MNDFAAEILRLLLRLEWAGDDVHHVCPSCQSSRMHGHTTDCDLAKKIEEAKGA